MMISEHQQNPSLHAPPWLSHMTNPTTIQISSHPYSAENVNLSSSPRTPTTPNQQKYDAILTALQRYLPSNTNTNNNITPPAIDFNGISDNGGDDLDLPPEVYTSDEFRMYDFKVRRCTRSISHDWTDCPYAHPGEKARRRDPRKYNYSGTACTDFRKGGCRKGDGCEFAHGVFESWLHPTRYRTQACKDGQSCQRRVCFFAHTPDQLRVLGSSDSSPTGGNSGQQYHSHLQPSSRSSGITGTTGSLNNSHDGYDDFFGSGSGSVSVSPSMSPLVESPPVTPMAAAAAAANSLSRSIGSSSITEIVASLRQLQLNKVNSMPNSWNANVLLGSPRFAAAGNSPNANTTYMRPGFFSLPVTPTRTGYNIWGENDSCGEVGGGGPVMERVESGRGLRAKMFEKLSKENILGGSDQNDGMNCSRLARSGPDVGWVSDLLR